MIDFELSEEEKNLQTMVHALSENFFRPISRKYDTYDHEHDEKVELEQVAAMMQLGHNIAYVADAVVQHSHTYSLRQEFQRYFDAGYARAAFADMFQIAGKDMQRSPAQPMYAFMMPLAVRSNLQSPNTRAWFFASVSDWTRFPLAAAVE